MSGDWIYLDYNASTPVADSVVEHMNRGLLSYAHPGAAHPAGRAAAELVREARETVARALGCSPLETIFCSGSTEAANQVIKGVAFSHPTGTSLHFVSSVVEHPATLQPLRFLERLGHRVTLLSVDRQGRVSVSQLEEALTESTALVSLIHAQNETGTVQPLAEVGEVCRARGVPFHVDASQSFGKIPVDVEELKADFLNIAGHKVYGPKGVGALFVRSGQRLEPLLHGGGQEEGARSGTRAPQLLMGLAEACRLVETLGPLSCEPAEHLWKCLREGLGDNVVRNGHPEHRVPNVVHATFRGVNGGELIERARVAASTGSACHSGNISPVLKAMGFSSAEAAGTVRLSCGRPSDLATVEEAAARLIAEYRNLTSSGDSI